MKKRKRKAPTSVQSAALRGAMTGRLAILERQLHRLEREIKRAEKQVKK